MRQIFAYPDSAVGFIQTHFFCIETSIFMMTLQMLVAFLSNIGSCVTIIVTPCHMNTAVKTSSLTHALEQATGH
jgi:hypothetical protein